VSQNKTYIYDACFPDVIFVITFDQPLLDITIRTNTHRLDHTEVNFSSDLDKPNSVLNQNTLF